MPSLVENMDHHIQHQIRLPFAKAILFEKILLGGTLSNLLEKTFVKIL